MEQKLLEMGAFFDSRAEQYDVVHPAMIGGGMESKNLIAGLLPLEIKRLLDFGCGTGLELKKIFKRFPDIKVTGIDLSEMMLAKLREKYPGQDIELIQGDYMTYGFKKGEYDAAVSVMTMHHFKPEEKLIFYRKLFEVLGEKGCYIECDYMVQDKEQEEFFFAEYERLKENQGIVSGYYHYDTPCTVMHQKQLLQQAGFKRIEEVWHKEDNFILRAYKN